MTDFEPTMTTEWGCVERGYEDDATWFSARGTAEFDVRFNVSAGLDCYLASRVVAIYPIVEVAS